MNTLLEQFSTFTKEDWIKFDELKSQAFEITLEEIETQRLQEIENKKIAIETKLANL